MDRLTLPSHGHVEGEIQAAVDDGDSQESAACEALVPVEASPVAAWRPEPRPCVEAEPLVPADIFQQILAKPNFIVSPVSSPEKETKTKAGRAEACGTLGALSAKTFLGGLMRSGALDGAEENILATLEDEKPDTEKPAVKPKAKAKVKAKAKAKGATTKKPSTVELEPQSHEGALRREASSQSLGGGGDVIQTPKRKKNAEDRGSSEKVSPPEKIKQPNNMGALPKPKRAKKSTEEIDALPASKRKKLLTSRAYHKTVDQAIRDGISKEDAKKLGREAAQKLSQQLNAERAGQ